MSPLADTAARVGALAEHLHFEVGPPGEPGWLLLPSMLETGLVLEREATVLAPTASGRDDHTGSAS